MKLTPELRILYAELHHSVQMQAVFADGKTWVDCMPKFTWLIILKAYREQKQQVGFDLKTFVHEYFAMPSTSQIQAPATGLVLEQRIEALWDVLTRPADQQPQAGSLLALPHPYIVPGGCFREIYYWDSYFTALGLVHAKRYSLFKNMLDNFAYLIQQLGFIPNGNRKYYSTRSQIPLFSFMVALYAEKIDEAAYVDYLPVLEKEYEFWMRGVVQLSAENNADERVVRIFDGSLLNRYWDAANTPRQEMYRDDMLLLKQAAEPAKLCRHLRAACESGWDFSSRWFEQDDLASINTTNLIPVDLNSALYHLEKTLAEASQRAGDIEQAVYYQTLAVSRAEAINKCLWNADTQSYHDYHFVKEQHTPHLTLAMLMPLFVEIASSEQAASVQKIVADNFVKAGGVVTTLKNSGQQWDSPNGWPPLQYITVKALLNYGYDDLAKDIMQRWVSMVDEVLQKTGKIMEKYNVVDYKKTAGGGEYPAQDGFGWTNGVTLDFIKQLE